MYRWEETVRIELKLASTYFNRKETYLPISFDAKIHAVVVPTEKAYQD